MRDDPVWYRSHIYLPTTPGPAYPGQAIGSPGDKFQVRDDPRYDGGTYMVYRKYGFDLEGLAVPGFHDHGRRRKGPSRRGRSQARDRSGSGERQGHQPCLAQAARSRTRPYRDRSHFRRKPCAQGEGRQRGTFHGPIPAVEGRPFACLRHAGYPHPPSRHLLRRTERHDGTGRLWPAFHLLPAQHPADRLRVHQQCRPVQSRFPAQCRWPDEFGGSVSSGRSKAHTSSCRPSSTVTPAMCSSNDSVPDSGGAFGTAHHPLTARSPSTSDPGSTAASPVRRTGACGRSTGRACRDRRHSVRF